MDVWLCAGYANSQINCCCLTFCVYKENCQERFMRHKKKLNILVNWVILISKKYGNVFMCKCYVLFICAGVD